MNVKKIKPFQSRRERRIEQRRQEIMTAAAQVFAEQGYAYATTKEIAAVADMAEGTLYNYFPGKRDILLAIADEMQCIAEQLFAEAGSLENRRDMVFLVERGLEMFVARLNFTRILLLEALVDDVILQEFVQQRLNYIAALVATFINERIEAQVFREVDSGMTTRMVLGMVLALMLPVLRGVQAPPTPVQCHDLAVAVVDLLLDGLRVRSVVEDAALSQGVSVPVLC
ncbi:MAG: TetR/AcrR family transcriptional regulator [Anaerolineae bacterium]|nr:TetR/AcrR family transcriptional regulator [Anaerolineae bacterium]